MLYIFSFPVGIFTLIPYAWGLSIIFSTFFEEFIACFLSMPESYFSGCGV